MKWYLEVMKKYAIALGFAAVSMVLLPALHAFGDPLTLGSIIAVALAYPLYGLIIGVGLVDPIAEYLESKHEESSTSH